MKSISTVNQTIKDVNIRFDNLLSNKFCQKVRKLNCPNTIKITTAETRLDMLSQKLYNTPDYDWVLALVNGLKSIEVKLGTHIKYPDLDDLNSLLLNER